MVGTSAITFIGAGSTESGALLADTGELAYSIINFPTVPFLTGDEVVYEPSDGIIGLDTGKSYYVRDITKQQQIRIICI